MAALSSSIAKMESLEASLPVGRTWTMHEDGGTYAGGWEKKKKNGYGVYRYPNGAVYEGEWKENLKQGHGVYAYANGGVYEGQWKDGCKHGFGVRTYKEGKRIPGEWKDGKLVGRLSSFREEELNGRVEEAVFESRMAASHARLAASRSLGEGRSFESKLKAIVVDPWILSNIFAASLSLMPWTLSDSWYSIARVCREAMMSVLFFCTGALLGRKTVSQTHLRLSLKAATVANSATAALVSALLIVSTLTPVSQSPLHTCLLSLSSVPLPLALSFATVHAEDVGFFALCVVVLAGTAMFNGLIAAGIHATGCWTVPCASVAGSWITTALLIGTNKILQTSATRKLKPGIMGNRPTKKIEITNSIGPSTLLYHKRKGFRVRRIFTWNSKTFRPSHALFAL